MDQNGWLRENPIQMDDDWGYPYFRKPPLDVTVLCIIHSIILVHRDSPILDYYHSQCIKASRIPYNQPTGLN